MTALAQKEIRENHNKFMKQISTPNVSMNPCDDSYIITEQTLQKGMNIRKKNCIYKQPEYDEGDWKKQFEMILPESFGNSFNVKTRKI
jgi:hypothetical protein